MAACVIAPSLHVGVDYWTMARGNGKIYLPSTIPGHKVIVEYNTGPLPKDAGDDLKDMRHDGRKIRCDLCGEWLQYNATKHEFIRHWNCHWWPVATKIGYDGAERKLSSHAMKLRLQEAERVKGEQYLAAYFDENGVPRAVPLSEADTVPAAERQMQTEDVITVPAESAPETERQKQTTGQTNFLGDGDVYTVPAESAPKAEPKKRNAGPANCFEDRDVDTVPAAATGAERKKQKSGG